MRQPDSRFHLDESSTRRSFITLASTGGVAALAGCSGGGDGSSSDSGDESSGDDDNPIDAEPENLLPAADLFGEGWEEGEQDSVTEGSLSPVDLAGDTVEASFASGDGLQGVDVQVTVFESVDGAMSGYEDMRDADSSDPSVEDADIASEAYLFDAFDTVYFRDANVIGILAHTSDSSTKTIEYGSDWHDTWRN